MQQFYRQLQNHGLNKAEALRAAQLAMLHGTVGRESESTNARGATRANPVAVDNSTRFALDPKAPFAHPYYWAPFILMGNWL
jgi:CHAT domain-containing protein